MARVKVAIRIEKNSNGIRALLQGSEVQADMARRANAVAAAAGEGYEAEVRIKGGSTKLGRAMGYVKAETLEARRDNTENNTLIRALEAGR